MRWIVPALFVLSISMIGCSSAPAAKEFARASASAANEGRAVAAADVPAPAAEPARDLFNARAQSLVRYMNVLGDLSANQMPQPENTSPLPAHTPDAAADAVSNLIAQKTQTGWRQVNTPAFIREADPSVQKLLDAMRDSVRNDFMKSLEADEKELKDTVDKSVAVIGQGSTTSDTQKLVQDLVAERKKALEARRSRLEGLARRLDKISEGHADLAKNADQLTDAALSDRLRRLTAEIQPR